MRIGRVYLALALGLIPAAPVLGADDPPARPRSRLGQWLHRNDAGTVPPAPKSASPAKPAAATDAMVKRTQDGSLPAPLPATTTPMVDISDDMATNVGAQSLSLQAALYGALTSNPDLVTLRQTNSQLNAPSPEAVEVARRFPTTLNPTLWLDYRPLTLIPNAVNNRDPLRSNQDYYRHGNQFLYLSLRQPVELGHQTRHRFAIARAALEQQRWVMTQAELTALVQTYRTFQTAAYRREKQRVARSLADFNDRLLTSLEKRLEANQGQAADVILARVESRSSRQLVMAARQDYVTALTDLRNQIGMPESAGAAEPLGEFTLPSYIPSVEEDEMIRLALESRPDIRAAQAQVSGAEAAVRLAKADRIPTPIVGPEYQTNESGSQFVGFVYITPIPVLNNGTPLVRQREAEKLRACAALQQVRQRVVAQVRAAVAKWNGATELVNESSGLAKELSTEVAKMERLFDEGQADLTKLLQVQQRLIQLENSQLDAVWAATQAQADLLLSLGTRSLIDATVTRAEQDATQNPRQAAP